MARNGINIGVCGTGRFAGGFIPLFQAHPLVGNVAIAEMIPERRREQAAMFNVTETYDSLDALCSSRSIDAIALFTPRHLHGQHVLQALNAGKHVYSAVPIAGSIDEVKQIIDLVTRTRLTYMVAETCYYYPAAIFCREKFRSGELGRFVYGEGEYFHDMSRMYGSYQSSGGENWKRIAGFPPMHYATHSISIVISVTGSYLTKVACLGIEDQHEDGIFGKGKNNWDNPFSNQTALFRTSDGAACRINEFRRIGHDLGNTSRTSIYGTLGCYEEQTNAQCWTTLDWKLEDLTERFKCTLPPKAGQPPVQHEPFYTLSKVHPAERLPRQFAHLCNGHSGSHQFLVDDFVRAVDQRRLAPNHAWAAARYTVPGLVAHESSMCGGQWMDIPDFGNPPADWPLITYPAL